MYHEFFVQKTNNKYHLMRNFKLSRRHFVLLITFFVFSFQTTIAQKSKNLAMGSSEKNPTILSLKSDDKSIAVEKG
jgi:hypothetical protein